MAGNDDFAPAEQTTVYGVVAGAEENEGRCDEGELSPRGPAPEKGGRHSQKSGDRRQEPRRQKDCAHDGDPSNRDRRPCSLEGRPGLRDEKDTCREAQQKQADAGAPGRKRREEALHARHMERDPRTKRIPGSWYLHAMDARRLMESSDHFWISSQALSRSGGEGSGCATRGLGTGGFGAFCASRDPSPRFAGSG